MTKVSTEGRRGSVARLGAIAAALAMVGCSTSNECPSMATCPVDAGPYVDRGPVIDDALPGFDAGGCDDACGAGFYCLGNRCVGEGDIGVPFDNPFARVCTPGAQAACACVGGGQGAQVCNRDGTGMGPCVCPDAGGVPSPDASAVDVDDVPAAPDVPIADDSDAGPAEDCTHHTEPCFCPDGTSSTHDPCVTEFCSCDGHMGSPDAGFDAGGG